jgi:hypothetical protein
MKYIIWHDNDYDLAFWVYLNSALADSDVSIRSIPKTNSTKQIVEYFSDNLTKIILPYIKFETPDIIIQQIYPTNKVIFVSEFMTHTPQWQHPIQRFARIYTSTLQNTPSTLVLPMAKTKWERGSRNDYKETKYRCSGSVYNLFLQAANKNLNPTLLFHWPDKDGYLIYDKKHATSPSIQDNMSDWFKFLNSNVLYDSKKNIEINDHQKKFMKSKSASSIHSDFDTICDFDKTELVIKKMNIKNSKIINLLKSRPETLVFCPKGLNSKNSKFRTDPYAGMICAFDVMFCRDENFQKKANIIFVATDVNKNEVNFISNNHDNKNCPFINTEVDIDEKHLELCNYTQPKYRRIYGDLADLIIFKDDIYFSNGNFYENK